MKKLILLFTVLTLVLLPVAAMADMAVLEGDFIGSISGDCLVTSDAWSGAVLSWEISAPVGTGPWTYSYTFAPGSSPDLSHIIIEVTRDKFSFVDMPGYPPLKDPDGLEGPTDWSFGPSNPGMPEECGIYGVKFNVVDGNPSITFTSFNSPVWGDFYAKGGDADFAYNASFCLGDDTIECKIARPNSVAPIPGSLLLLGSGIMGLVGIGIRRKSS